MVAVDGSMNKYNNDKVTEVVATCHSWQDAFGGVKYGATDGFLMDVR